MFLNYPVSMDPRLGGDDDVQAEMATNLAATAS